MSVRVLSWQPQPGQLLPDPILKDDSDKFPPTVVKNVRQWLEHTREDFAQPDSKPTPITITIPRGVGPRHVGPTPITVDYGVGKGIRETARFRHSTVEIRLKNRKHGPVEATYHYLVARDRSNRCILGPQLRVDQKERIELCR